MTESMRALGRLCWARKAGRVNGKDPDWVSSPSCLSLERICVMADAQWATVAAMESRRPDDLSLKADRRREEAR